MRFFPHIQIFSQLYNLPPRQAFWSSRRPDSLAITKAAFVPNSAYSHVMYYFLLSKIHLQVPEVKDLVIDPQLMKPLDHFTGASFLKVTT